MRKLIVFAAIALLLSACLPTSTPTPPTPTPTPAGPCTITAVNNPATIYKRPSAAADQFATLGVGQSQQATNKTADGFYGFDPGIAQAGNYGLFHQRWVLKTVDVTTSAGCAAIPVVVGPITGICYAMFANDTPVYSSPNTSSAQVATYHTGDYAMITAHTTGWFTLDLNVGSPSMDSVGYLQESDLGGVNGPCDAF